MKANYQQLAANCACIVSTMSHLGYKCVDNAIVEQCGSRPNIPSALYAYMGVMGYALTLIHMLLAVADCARCSPGKGCDQNLEVRINLLTFVCSKQKSRFPACKCEECDEGTDEELRTNLQEETPETY